MFIVNISSREGAAPDTGDTMGDYDASQAATAIEGPLFNTGDAIRDGDAC